jgi:hypothetical protein
MALMPFNPFPPSKGYWITPAKIDSRNYPSHVYLQLPLQKLINGVFQLDVCEETSQDFYTKELYLENNFIISTPYRPENDSIQFKYGIGLDKYAPEQTQRVKDHFKSNSLQLLNKIEYFLSCPLDDLCLYLNESDGTQLLVAWRFQLPKGTEELLRLEGSIHLSVQPQAQ